MSAAPFCHYETHDKKSGKEDHESSYVKTPPVQQQIAVDSPPEGLEYNTTPTPTNTGHASGPEAVNAPAVNGQNPATGYGSEPQGISGYSSISDPRGSGAPNEYDPNRGPSSHGVSEYTAGQGSLGAAAINGNNSSGYGANNSYPQEAPGRISNVSAPGASATQGEYSAAEPDSDMTRLSLSSETTGPATRTPGSEGDSYTHGTGHAAPTAAFAHSEDSAIRGPEHVEQKAPTHTTAGHVSEGSRPYETSQDTDIGNSFVPSDSRAPHSYGATQGGTETLTPASESGLSSSEYPEGVGRAPGSSFDRSTPAAADTHSLGAGNPGDGLARQRVTTNAVDPGTETVATAPTNAATSAAAENAGAALDNALRNSHGGRGVGTATVTSSASNVAAVNNNKAPVDASTVVAAESAHAALESVMNGAPAAVIGKPQPVETVTTTPATVRTVETEAFVPASSAGGAATGHTQGPITPNNTPQASAALDSTVA